jgi:hypothetical protein
MPTPFDAIWPADIVSHVRSLCIQMAGAALETSQQPSESEILAMLSQSFAASLERDEGRDTAFTLAYRAPDAEIDYAFEKVLPLEPRILRRLAAATDPRRCWLCFGKRGDDLGLIGLMVMSGSRSMSWRFGGTFNFSVRVVGSGVLLGWHTASPLLAHRRGKTTVYSNPIQQSGVLYRAMELPPMRTYDPVVFGHRMRAGHYLVEAVAAHGHGGTLLVLPPDADWKGTLSSSHFLPRKPCARACDYLRKSAEEEPVVREVEQSVAQIGGDVWNRFRHESPGFQEALDWIAKLTATDGMTVIESDLTLLAFGVMVQMQGTREGDLLIEEHTLFEPPQRKTLAQIGGGRHQAAAHTCATLRGSVAFVASQDGELTAMRWDDQLGGVLLSRNLELLL